MELIECNICNGSFLTEEVPANTIIKCKHCGSPIDKTKAKTPDQDKKITDNKLMIEKLCEKNSMPALILGIVFGLVFAYFFIANLHFLLTRGRHNFAITFKPFVCTMLCWIYNEIYKIRKLTANSTTDDK